MPTVAWMGVCLLHATVSTLVWLWMDGAMPATLIWRADGWLQRPWTLWSAAWVHVNTAHWVGNQLALGALAAMAWVVRPGLGASVAWLLAWPILFAALRWWPQVGYAVGLSGVVHAGVAVVVVHLLSRSSCGAYRQRRWGVLLACGLCAKLALEQGWHWPVVWSPGAHMSVVQAAHLTGTLAGALCATLVAIWVRERPSNGNAK